MADHPTGPDDEVTPVDGPSRDVNWPVPSGPRAGPRPAFGQPRDSQPPRPAPSPVPTTKPAWVEGLREPKTNPGGIASNAYVKRKLRRMAAAIGGAAVTTITGGGLYEHSRHQGSDERQARVEQQLEDHIAAETQHYSETTKRLDQLLELELKRREDKGR